MITDFKCNRVYLSAKMASLCPITFQKLTEVLSRHTIKWSLLEGTNDIWCRDFMPIQFDTKEDIEALDQISSYMPDYKIEMVDSRDLVVHGGGLNCCSWTTCEDIISILKIPV